MVRVFFLLFVLLFAVEISAQHQHTPPSEEAQQEQEHMHAGHSPDDTNPAVGFLLTEGAGTSVNPGYASSVMPTRKVGSWDLMEHWYVFLNGIQQTGPRGDDRIFSSNHLMLIGAREFNEKSALFVRGMFSLEPATVADRQYPLLFQTGETAFDEPIVDGQHPHDFFMELSVQYATEIRENTLLHFYAAPVGDPALGPVAFPHRTSAQELPQATLSHHLQDSTHIAFNVLTAGIKHKSIRWEFGGFHGTEPDEKRWNLDGGAINSWASRITFTPNPQWTAQFSTGRLKDPEAHEPGDIHRTTASISNYTPLKNGFFATSLLWGRNHRVEEDRNLNSYGFEALYRFHNKNNLTGRIELVDRDELFADSHDEHEEELEGAVFRVAAFTMGYARDFDLIPGLRTGVGGNFTFYSFPSVLEPFYGDSPKGFLFYFRMGSAHH